MLGRFADWFNSRRMVPRSHLCCIGRSVDLESDVTILEVEGILVLFLNAIDRFVGSSTPASAGVRRRLRKGFCFTGVRVGRGWYRHHLSRSLRPRILPRSAPMADAVVPVF